MAEEPPGRRPPAPPPTRPARSPRARPEYKVYRAGGGPLSRLRPGERLGSLPRPGRRGRRDRAGGGGLTPKRIIAIVAGLALGWLLLSVVLFFVSAQTSKGVSDEAEEALSGGGTLVTGSTILVLGSDERSGGVEVTGSQGGRADSILLLHVGFGTVRRLSILRDSAAEIPGQGIQKINAAYFFGGPELMIETVEGFMGNGLEINHLIEVNFNNFPELIDALGGVDVTNPSKIVAADVDSSVTAPDECAPGKDDEAPAAGFRLDKGECHLDGKQALTFARVRTNLANPGEDDSDRAARQQEVLSGMRSQVFSPTTFFRLPWVGWQAPRAIRSDLKGPGLAALFTDLLTGGSGETNVLEPLGPGPGGSLTISEEERANAVAELLGRD